jgi:peptidoglycan/xylan/chitin deacetylase (PgdA/CDA1 family)
VRRRLPFFIALLIAGASSPALSEEKCANPQGALGVSRIVDIDATTGPLFGAFTKYEKEPRFLGPKEVVLTFDDGPMPKFTKPILDTLDKYCTKATFFYVGRMAQAYPSMVQEVMGRGHTMGTHTWSHPMNMRRLALPKAVDQIERGFAAVALAAGQPIAPFFRFPGLSDSGPMLQHLQERGIAAFTVDVVSNDSYIASPSRLAQRTLEQIERQNGGIVLFHDIKSSTARALPTILSELKKRGYKIVHLRATKPFEPLPALTAELTKGTATASGEKRLVPFYEAIAPIVPGTNSEPEVTEIHPSVRERTHAGGTHATADDLVPDSSASAATTSPTGTTVGTAHDKKKPPRHQREYDPNSLTNAVSGRW